MKDYLDGHIDAYRRDGFVLRLDVYLEAEVAQPRGQIGTLEAEHADGATGHAPARVLQSRRVERHQQPAWAVPPSGSGAL